ncbi:hypothetical protein RRG08_031107 [Elysia crispata]|uniref:Uncharacterized protein n=1 Tax=Elysia crispata TaxID=231223 RepID=A0AAE1DFU3_9GAST|nr:hypothetical protein RRG08_031107 [Elysia crispata]
MILFHKAAPAQGLSTWYRPSKQKVLSLFSDDTTFGATVFTHIESLLSLSNQEDSLTPRFGIVFHSDVLRHNYNKWEPLKGELNIQYSRDMTNSQAVKSRVTSLALDFGVDVSIGEKLKKGMADGIGCFTSTLLPVPQGNRDAAKIPF